MKVKYLVNKNYPIINELDSIYKACLIMFKKNIDVLPVVNGNIKGILSSIDIINYYAKYKNLNVLVKNVMNKCFYSLDQEESLDEASELFSLYGINNLIITENNKYLGLLSIKDLTYDEDFINLAYNAIKQTNIM